MQTGKHQVIQVERGFAMIEFDNACAACEERPLSQIGALIYRPERDGFDALCITCVEYTFRAAEAAIAADVVDQELEDDDRV